MASDDRIRLSPDDRNCCVSKLQLLAYGSTSYVASSSIMKYAHQVPDRLEQINVLWSGYLSAMDKGHLQPLNIMIFYDFSYTKHPVAAAKLVWWGSRTTGTTTLTLLELQNLRRGLSGSW